MKRKSSFLRFLAAILSVIMLLGAISLMAVGAAAEEFKSETHTVFKDTKSTLAPGVTQNIKYAYAADGKQMVYYVTTADITRDDVIVQTSYSQQYRDGVYAMAKLTDQAASANEYYSDKSSKQFISENYNVVAGVNASFYNMTTGQPTGVAFIDGVSFGTTAYDNFFAILKDGTAVIDYRSNLSTYTGNRAIWQAAGGSQWLVRDGVDVTASATGSYNLDRHCRTCVGITSDGKVVLMVLDGRQEPFSCGGSMHELAQIMLEAGCVAAINLDGGGSTTYIARQEGEDQLSIVNRPSDGSERAISTGLIVASTAAPSNVFERATLTADNDYITANAQAVISVKGISPAGTAAEVPADALLKLADESFGTIVGNVFTPAKTGDAVIQMIYKGSVVGQTTVHVVVPDAISFEVAAFAVPYGKTAEIRVLPTYGEFRYAVKFTAQDVEFSFDSMYGSVNGLNFTATSDSTVTDDGEITVTVVGTQVSDTVPINVGRGSEVLFDFEDGSTDDWGCFDYYNANVNTTIKTVDASTGKVHSGNYAMAYTFDFSQLTYYEDYIVSDMTYNAESIKDHDLTFDPDGVSMYGLMEDYVNITGATRLGFWVYIPDEIDVAGLNPRFTFGYKKTATSAWTRGTSDMNAFMIERDGMGTDGWYYFSADLSAFSSYYAMTMQNNRLDNVSNKNGNKNVRYYGAVVEWYVEDRAWKNNETKSYNGKMTLYIDDITVDYSSVVEDREQPIFGNVSYAYVGMADATVLKDNAVITSNVIDFSAVVADNMQKSNATGINAATAKAYIDGNAVEATYQNGKISIDSAVTFTDGVHTVKFEISDNKGNTSHVVKTFTINSGVEADTIKIVPHNTTLTSTPVGSLYYIDVVATDISSVKDVTVKLKVNNVNDWQPEGIIVNSAFTVSYTQDVCDNGLITLTITKTGDVTETGEDVLVSVPVRAWYPHNALGKDSTWIITTKKCVYPMDIQVLTKAGSVTFTDGSKSTFSAKTIQIDSEAMCAVGYIGVNKGNEGGTNKVTSWHEHSATASPDAPATCTTAGYTGRTYCEGCKSVVDWGTKVDATGHNYELADGKFVCATCDDVYAAGTGLFEMNGKWYYAVQDVVSSGWHQENEAWYYFLPDTFERANGSVKTTDGITFNFEDGKVTSHAWVASGSQIKCWYGPSYYKNVSQNVFYRMVEVDGYNYMFDSNGFMVRGVVTTHESNSSIVIAYDCGNDGKARPYTGVYNDFVFVDGVRQAPYQVVSLGGDHYLVYDGYKIAKNKTVYVVKDWMEDTGLPSGYYEFDADGKMIVKNGPDADGYFYIDGVKQKAYHLFEYEGNYYLTYDFHKYVVSRRIYVTADMIGDAPFAVGYYEFDANGKMIVKNGPDADGYFYINGVKQSANQLLKYEGAYYYVGANGKYAVNKKITLDAVTVEGTTLAAGEYEFDASGKLVSNSGPKADGYFYINGVKQKAYHLFEYEGNYYLTYDFHKYVVNKRVYVTADMIGDVPFTAGYYEFDANGKMIIKNGPGADGYFYINGVKQKAYHLFECEGNYYLTYDFHKYVANKRVYVTADMIGDAPFAAGYYEFDADGRIIVKNGPNADGYFYVNSVKQKAYQAIEYDGDYYYIGDAHKYAVNKKVFLSAAMVYGTDLIPGYYTFGSDGKLIKNN